MSVCVSVVTLILPDLAVTVQSCLKVIGVELTRRAGAEVEEPIGETRVSGTGDH